MPIREPIPPNRPEGAEIGGGGVGGAVNQLLRDIFGGGANR